MNANETGNTPNQKSGGQMQLISFKVSGEEFGVDIDQVKEILKLSTITPVPKAPPFLLGMMNLRGTIIPVLDLKQRLGQEPFTATVKTRILVLQVAGDLSGIVVDEVSEVQRIDTATIEPPPQVTRGIDRFFLQGVAKLKANHRLIMMLNLQEVLHIEISRDRHLDIRATAVGAELESDDHSQNAVAEEHLALFFLGEEEFGIDIATVREILRVAEITAVPNVPPYVKGIQNVRDAVLPIIDLRVLVKMKSLEHGHTELVEQMRNGHLAWAEELQNAVYKGTPFTKSNDPAQCQLGKLLEYQKKHDIEFMDMYKQIKPPHDALHHHAGNVLEKFKSNPEAAGQIFHQQVSPHLETLLGLFPHLEEVLNQRAKRDQRVFIVNIGLTTVGLLVDKVSEVVRLPKSIIDSTPTVISTYGKEIKGIAKLNQGSRLILLLDEKLLLSIDEMAAIAQIGEEQSQTTEVEAEIVERQVVVFSVAGEEFGISIQHVREIFKPDEITPVPKAPLFIRGVTNVRGNIVPVVDVKERFGILPDSTGRHHLTSYDESPTVLVTFIKDITVGLLVDSVQEVLRIKENWIEAAPSLVLSNVDTGYLDGIAKLNDGTRIILLLNIDEIMSKKEFLKLHQLKSTVETTAEPAEKLPPSDPQDKQPTPPKKGKLKTPKSPIIPILPITPTPLPAQE